MNDTAEQRFHRFQAMNTAHTLETRSAHWDYYAGGSGMPPLLMLPGGETLAEAGFEWLLAFQQHSRVLAPSYPTNLTRVESIVEGLIDLIEQEKLEQVDVLGTSLGGMIAQSLVRACPQRVHRLVLSQTTAPYPPYGEKLRKRLNWFRRLPARLVRWLLLQSLERTMRDEPEALFWMNHMRRLYSQPTSRARDVLTSSYNVIVDFCLNTRFTPQDLSGWEGRVLMIDAEEDRSIPPEGRDALHQLYPNAQIYQMTKAGHTLGSPRRAEYVRVVREFLTSTSL